MYQQVKQEIIAVLLRAGRTDLVTAIMKIRSPALKQRMKNPASNVPDLQKMSDMLSDELGPDKKMKQDKKSKATADEAYSPADASAEVQRTLAPLYKAFAFDIEVMDYGFTVEVANVEPTADKLKRLWADKRLKVGVLPSHTSMRPGGGKPWYDGARLAVIDGETKAAIMTLKLSFRRAEGDARSMTKKLIEFFKKAAPVITN